MQVRLLRLGIVRMAGHGDVAAGGFLVQRRVQLAPVQQPFFQVRHRFGLTHARFELVKQRRNLRPVTQVDGGRNKRTRFRGASFQTATNSCAEDKQNPHKEKRFVCSHAKRTLMKLRRWRNTS